MKLTMDHDRIVRMLKESITLMCKSALAYDSELSVEGLLGITLDKKDVFLVNINQSFHPEFSSAPSQEASYAAKDSPQRRKHGGRRDSSDGHTSKRRRRSQNDSPTPSPGMSDIFK